MALSALQVLAAISFALVLVLAFGLPIRGSPLLFYSVTALYVSACVIASYPTRRSQLWGCWVIRNWCGRHLRARHKRKFTDSSRGLCYSWVFRRDVA